MDNSEFNIYNIVGETQQYCEIYLQELNHVLTINIGERDPHASSSGGGGGDKVAI